MTTQQMKEAMLREHKRDVRLMYKNMAVIGTCALFVLGLFLFLIIGTGSSVSQVASSAVDNTDVSSIPNYVKFVLPIALLTSIGYPIYAWWKMSKRPEQIDKLVNYVDNGTRVVQLTETKEYRIKLPLIVVNYHTGAVKTLHIVLEGVKTPFSLPVPFDVADDVKDLLNENS